MINASTPASRAQVGDWIVAHSISGGTSRRGQVIELLGDQPHARYRVRWDEMHESILYPADGVEIVPRRGAPNSSDGVAMHGPHR